MAKGGIVKAGKKFGLNLIERALIAKTMRAEVVSAEIHALLGDDSDELVHKAGRILWIVLEAVVADGVDPEMLEVRIMRGACNAIYEQKGEARVTETRRASICSGLEAAERLFDVLPQRALTDAAVAMEVRLRNQNAVGWHEFEQLLAKVAA